MHGVETDFTQQGIDCVMSIYYTILTLYYTHYSNHVRWPVDPWNGGLVGLLHSQCLHGGEIDFTQQGIGIIL